VPVSGTERPRQIFRASPSGISACRATASTAATLFYTQRDSWCWFFGAIDHCVEDVVGWYVAKVGDRWAALEPIRQGVRRTHGGCAPKIALGLGLRMDRGPQYTAHQFPGGAALPWDPPHAELCGRA
jgi:hypothetical protein